MNYLETFGSIARVAPVFMDKRLRVRVLANPAAGGFTMSSRAGINKLYYNAALQQALDIPGTAVDCETRVYRTTHKGHAASLVNEILAEASRDTDFFYLLVTAGGDGTSHEVQTALAAAFFKVRNDDVFERLCILRLPLGTGNDGSDGRTLDQSLNRLIACTEFDRQKAVRVYTAGCIEQPHYAFNIASIGFDAFVTHMTNRVKKYMPGNLYKTWVDLACLFYGWIYPVAEMMVTGYTRDGHTLFSQSDRILFYLMGSSGNRTYGAGISILPDEDNVCGVRDMPLHRKLALKPRFNSGSHRGLAEVFLSTAERLVFNYREKILVQMDGESLLLNPADFPLTMELTEPFLYRIK